jgi:hypothetical protein
MRPLLCAAEPGGPQALRGLPQPARGVTADGTPAGRVLSSIKCRIKCINEECMPIRKVAFRNLCAGNEGAGMMHFAA